MARIFRIAILTACIFYAGRAFAAGGACPSGASYIDPSTGSLVTLSSVGVTNCYYISAAGSDSNSGTTESSPWLHAPQMPTCSGNCATVQNQSGGIPPGTGLIFSGGDTWHLGNSSASPYTGGTWDFNTGQAPDGTLANPIYIGVDPTWFSGASWARPILTGDNPTSTSATLSSCTYTIAGGTNNIVGMRNRQHYVFDNFELLGMCQSDTGAPNSHDNYFQYGFGTDIRFLNHYLHGWTHVRFQKNASPTDCSGGGVCFNIIMFSGGSNGEALPGVVIDHVVIDGSDSDPRAAGECTCDHWTVAHSVIRYTSQTITSFMHLFHDNWIDHHYDNGHGNVLESNNNSDAHGTNAFYNNIFSNLSPDGVSHVGIWPSPPVGSTDYFFNNLMYAVGPLEIFNVGLNGLNQGPIVAFNNTFQISSNSGNGAIFGCQSANAHPFIAANNHYIIDTAAYSNPCNSLTDVTNLLMSNTAATKNGYTVSQSYAYSPTSTHSPTVGTGTNNEAFCLALSTAASSDPTLKDAAFACQSDTRYACTYIISDHTVSCPARTAVARPVKSAWDKGAYQSNGTQANAPNPPSNLTAVVQP